MTDEELLETIAKQGHGFAPNAEAAKAVLNARAIAQAGKEEAKDLVRWTMVLAFATWALVVADIALRVWLEWRGGGSPGVG